jgi:phosphate-selective porin OprO and OprP
VASAVVLVLLVGSGRALAQSGAASPVTVTWDNGLSVASGSGANIFQLGGLVQMDGRFAPDDPLRQVEDEFVMRRVRMIMQGRFAKYFEFRVMPDFANSTTVLYDAYLDVRFSQAFRVRFGKDKTPVGLEQLYSDYALLFPERSLASNLVPNRDIGVQVQGRVAGVFSYIGGIFNGVPDAANGDVDTGAGKDLAGRLTVRPFARTHNMALREAGVAVGATSGTQAGALPVYHSTAQQVFFAYAAGAFADGDRTRVSPSAFYYYGPIGAFAEYARTTQAVQGPHSSDTPTNTAWEITGAFVITGEAASERGVVPSQPFDPALRHFGALQMMARYSHVAVAPSVFANGLAGAGASQTASAAGVGMALYANQAVKFVLTFERTSFDDNRAGSRLPEHAIVFRAQVNLQPSL